MHHLLLVTGLHIACASKTTSSANSSEPAGSPAAENSEAPPIRTVNPPPPDLSPISPPPAGVGPKPPDIRRPLPSWEDLDAPETVKEPVEGLGLSADLKICYKEWFQGDSVHPHVLKYGGRILKEGESTIGRMIACPEERKAAFLSAYQADQK